MGGEAALVIGLLLFLFRLRSYLGLYPLCVALGVFQPFQVFLTASIYVPVLPGFVVSPGSVIMFTASLFAILLVYIREGTVVARKVIYGIMIANLGMTGLLYLSALHLALPGTLNFLSLPVEMFNLGGRVMFAGTLALFVDVLLIIFVFETVRRFIPKSPFLRIYLTMSLVLVMDSLIFTTIAFAGRPDFFPLLFSGIAGKVLWALFFAAGLAVYLRFAEVVESDFTLPFTPYKDIFHALTYREKYEIERAHAQTSLARSEKKFRTIFNASNDVFFVCDMEKGRILDVNESVHALLGYTPEEMTGQDISILESVHPGHNWEGESAMEKVSDGGSSWFEWQCRHKDGQLVWVEATVSSVVIDDQKRRLVILRDVTERRQVEAERYELQAHVRQTQKLEGMGTLAGGIAHDFNNILGAIIGYAELIKDECDPVSDVGRHIDEVLSAGHRAADLVRQITALSQGGSKEPVPLKPIYIIKEAVKFLKQTLPATIIIREQLDADTPSIMADPTQIHQVMMNLCINAFHAMESCGGALDIQLCGRNLNGEDIKNVPGISPGYFVMLSIADTGSGIPSEIRDKIFNPYFTTKPAGKGTGMGLSIVQGIVEAEGGFMTCESTPGSGTCFQVFFPASEPKISETSQPIPEEPDTDRENILFVDDEKPLTELARSLFPRLGYRVTTFNSSLEALAYVKEAPHRFDLVITDYNMPGMTGLELSRNIQAIRRDLPIILCTGYSEVIDETRVNDYGIKGFIMKPIARNEIAALIRIVLDEHGKEKQDMREEDSDFSHGKAAETVVKDDQSPGNVEQP